MGRLHQRIPQLSISAQTLQNILAEDSGHYLAYSLMFMSGRQHAALILIPIIAFAIMHVSNFSNKIFAETSFSFAKGQQADQYAANPSTPGILKTLITKAQAICYRL